MTSEVTIEATPEEIAEILHSFKATPGTVEFFRPYVFGGVGYGLFAGMLAKRNIPMIQTVAASLPIAVLGIGIGNFSSKRVNLTGINRVTLVKTVI